MTDPTFLGQPGMSTPLPWMDHAECVKHPDPDLWFPARNQHDPRVQVAIAICRECPVTAECLATAMTDLRLEGIWGGTTHRERRGNRRGNR